MVFGTNYIYCVPMSFVLQHRLILRTILAEHFLLTSYFLASASFQHSCGHRNSLRSDEPQEHCGC